MADEDLRLLLQLMNGVPVAHMSCSGHDHVAWWLGFTCRESCPADPRSLLLDELRNLVDRVCKNLNAWTTIVVNPIILSAYEGQLSQSSSMAPANL